MSEVDETAPTKTQQRTSKNRPWSISDSVPVILYSVVVIVALVTVYFLMVPSRIDTCASEILTNGKGMNFDLGAKTVQLSAESKQVPIQEVSDRSTLIIDSLSRLCRERAAGTIDENEYNSRFDRLISSITETTKSTSASLPVFNGEVDARGYGGNRKLIDFLESNNGRIARFILEIDVSYMPPDVKNGEACAIEGDAKEGEPRIFNLNIPIPDFSVVEMQRESKKNDIWHNCDKYVLHFKSENEPTYTSGGSPVTIFSVDGFFRINLSVTGASNVFYLTEVPATVSDYAN